MMRPLCIYHANCADGFGAAWVVRKFFKGEVDFHAAQYGEAAPDVKGRDVVMVDFSYKRPVIDQMGETVSSLLILDHHKTARDDLAGIRYAPAWPQWRTMLPGLKVAALFDMERSGAGLAWDYFFPTLSRPRLIQHVEDRDLWRFKFEGTREIQSAVVSYPWDFAIWDQMSADAQTVDGLKRLTAEGAAIDRKLQKDIAAILAHPPRRMLIGGISVPVANVPAMWASDTAGKMAEGEPFAATYFDMPDGRVFSLRSRGDGADVSAIAAQYGGGGHRNAAGFKLPLGVDPS